MFSQKIKYTIIDSIQVLIQTFHVFSRQTTVYLFTICGYNICAYILSKLVDVFISFTTYILR